MKNMLSVLSFYIKYPGWYTFKGSNRATKNAVKSLQQRGYLEVNNFDQARYTGKIW